MFMNGCDLDRGFRQTIQVTDPIAPPRERIHRDRHGGVPRERPTTVITRNTGFAARLLERKGSCVSFGRVQAPVVTSGGTSPHSSNLNLS